MTKTYLLTGDIGGTNSRMALYEAGNNKALKEIYYQNEKYLSKKDDGVFENNIIAPFLTTSWETIAHIAPLDDAQIVACLACAGPVGENKVAMSNLGGIVIDGNAIASGTYCSDVYVAKIVVCKVINDFVAQGYGCLTLQPKEVRELTPNSFKMVSPDGPKVCVGAGTGLGECYLTPGSDGSYSCFPSEGGHTEYNPRSDLEAKLRTSLMKKFGNKHRLSTERVVSGPGLANVYEFLANEFPKRVDKKVHQEFLDATDQKGKVVSVNAAPGSLCHEALMIMISAYGSEVGSAAIKWIPTGGLYVTGGLTPKNIKHIEGEGSEFMKAYTDKGRVSPVLNTIPLFAVMVEDLGVRGAHKCCVMEFERLQKDTSESQAPKISNNGAWSVGVVVAGAAVGAGLVLALQK